MIDIIKESLKQGLDDLTARLSQIRESHGESEELTNLSGELSGLYTRFNDSQYNDFSIHSSAICQIHFENIQRDLDELEPKVTSFEQSLASEQGEIEPA